MSSGPTGGSTVAAGHVHRPGGPRAPVLGPLSLGSAVTRLTVLAVVVTLVAVGLHAQVGTPVFDTGSRTRDAEVAGTLDAVAVMLLGASTVWSRLSPTDQVLVARLRLALRYVLGTSVAVLTLALVALLVKLPVSQTNGNSAPRAAQNRVPARPLRAVAPHNSGLGFPLREIFYGVLAAALLVALLGIWWRLRGMARTAPAPAEEPLAEEYDHVLQEAVAGGQRALQSLDDARAAIIACYVAMEESLARAGTARATADTPDELLAKAAGALRQSGAAAKRLTALFYEARFSSHPMDQRRRHDAQTALAELAADLGSPSLPGTRP